ncbi:MAG: trigger factor [Terracidiphilus sp.]
MSSTDTVENTPQPDMAEAARSIPGDRPEPDGHAHDHEPDHEHGPEHEHTHGPAFNPDCTRELMIDVPAEEVSKAYQTVVGEYRKHARIPGFRNGKVPETVIRSRFAEKIRKEVIDILVPERFSKAVHDLGVQPVGEPRVTELTFEDGQPLHMKATFECIPEFSIDGYQAVTVERPPVEVTEEEFQHEMEQLRDARAVIEPVEEDRVLQDGDWAEISYKGQIEGDADGAALSGENTLVEVGGKETVEAFSTILRGARPGQEVKAEVVYPAEFSEARLAGKTVTYEIEVKSIKKRIVPELNDDFARELGKYESMAELESQVRAHMAIRKRQSVEGETKDRLLAALIERYPFAVPETLVEEQIDTRLERGLRALAAQGMETEQMRKLDFVRLRAAQRDSAVAEVKANLLLDRIAAEEKISVSDEELNNELQLAAFRSRETVETLRTRLTSNGGLTKILEQLRRGKAANLLYERLPA